MASTHSSGSATGNLRRRKNANEDTPAPAAQTRSTTEQQQPNIQRPPTHPRPGQQNIPKWKAAFIFVLWIPFMILLNPYMAPRLLYGLLHIQSGGPPCSGDSCHIDPSNFNRDCGPSSNPSRVLFLHIPKTGGTTLRKEFARVAPTKGVSVHDIGEVEDLVPSIPIPGLQRDLLGYHNPEPRRKARRVSNYYKSAYSMLVYPPNAHRYNRTMYHGHFYYNGDWAEALRYIPMPAWHCILPFKLRQFLKLDRPKHDDLTIGSNNGLEIITMLRKPKDRLKSMYYYDRLVARWDNWRTDFISRRGNTTLEECLLNETCIKVNELQRWCSVQTEMLCGGPSKAECRTQPLGRDALEIAKENLRNGVLFAGTTDRMEDSLALLEKLLPTYLEGIPPYSSSFNKGNSKSSVGNAPREKSTLGKQESSFSEEATKVLDDLCQLDEELYQYANDLLTDRITRCLQR